jgi:hypothetical protein
MYFSKPMPSLIKFGNVTSKTEIFNFKTKNKQDFHVKAGKYGATQTMEVKSTLASTLAPLADGEQDKTSEIKGR